MKNYCLLFCLTLLLAAGRANATSFKIGDIVNLMSYQSTQASIEAVLGKPDRMDQTDKEMRWEYRRDKQSLIIFWNKEQMQVVKYSFASHAESKPEWKDADGCKIRVGSTDMKTAVNLLGTPSDMAVTQDHQQMQFMFKDHVIRLEFRKDKLLHYEVRGLERKS